MSLTCGCSGSADRVEGAEDGGGSGAESPEESGAGGTSSAIGGAGPDPGSAGSDSEGSGGVGAEESCPGIAPDPFAFVPPDPQGATKFRILYVIKPYVDAPGYQHSMTDEQIDAGREALGVTFPQMVADHTGGSIIVDATVMVLPRVVTSNAVIRGVSDRPGVWPDDMPTEDLLEYFGVFARGYYDQVQNYNAIPDFQYVNSGWFETEAEVSWSVLNRRSDLGYDQDALAGAWHEWLHGFETYYYHYSDFAQTAPDSCVHCAGEHGYTVDSGGAPFWIGWYRDIATGTNGLGFGPAAFEAHGTPRSRFDDVAPFLDSGAVRIEARHSSRLLVWEDGTARQGPYGTGMATETRFQLAQLEGDRVRILTSIGEALTESSSGIVLTDSATEDRDAWRPVYTGFGHFALFNECTGNALEVEGAELSSGASARAVAYVGARNQQFRLIGLDLGAD